MSRRRWLVDVAALLCLALVCSSAVAVAAEKPKVGYLGSDTSGDLSGEALAALDAGAAAGLRATATVRAVDVPQTAVVRLQKGRLCAGETCVRTLAGQTGAEYFVRAEVRRKGETDYAGTLDLIRAAPFAVVFTGDFECSGCVATKLGRRTELSVSELLSKLVESLEAKTTTIRQTTEPGLIVATPAPETLDRRRWSWIAWSATGVAVASLTGAYFAFTADNKGTCMLSPLEKECPRLRATKALGYSLVGVGLLATAGAVVSFVKIGSSDHVEVAVGTTGTALVVAGRF